MIKNNSKTYFTNEIMKIFINIMTITAQDAELSQCQVLHGTQMKLKKIRIQSLTPHCQKNKSLILNSKIHAIKKSFPSIIMMETSNRKLRSIKFLKKNRFNFMISINKVRKMHLRQKKNLRKISQIIILKHFRKLKKMSNMKFQKNK